MHFGIESARPKKLARAKHFSWTGEKSSPADEKIGGTVWMINIDNAPA